MNHVGRLVKRLRYKHDLRAKDLAKHLGVTSGFVCDFENGRRKISIKMLFKISSFFKEHDYLIELEKAFFKEYRIVQIKMPKNKDDRERLFDLIYSFKEEL